MKNKKHIAMRCNKEQFEAIKPKLKELKIEDLSSFEDCPFLTNNLRGEKDLISNIGSHDAQSRGREYVEQWNEKIFLEACGIETIPTLEEAKEYFKNADKCVSIQNTEFHNENWFWDSFYIQKTPKLNIAYIKDGAFEVWNSKKGYAKILTYKTPKFEITKETVIKYQMKEEFPEVFKVELEVGKWYKRIWKSNGDVDLFPIYDICKEGDIDDKGNYFRNEEILESIFKVNISMLKDNRVIVSEATPEEVTKALKKEAVRMYKNGQNLSSFICGNQAGLILDDFRLENGIFKSGDFWLMKDGTWATVIQTKTIQQAEELLKELGHEIKIVS